MLCKLAGVVIQDRLVGILLPKFHVLSALRADLDPVDQGFRGESLGEPM